MPSSVSENGMPHQQARGILPDPAQGKQRQRVTVGGEGGQVVHEVELQPRTDDQRGEQRQQQQQEVQPVGPAARRRGDKDLWIAKRLRRYRRLAAWDQTSLNLHDSRVAAEAGPVLGCLAPRRGPSTTGDRLRGTALLDRLQFLAGLEADGLAGRNVDLGAGARVAANAGLARAHGEDAEAAQLNAIAA